MSLRYPHKIRNVLMLYYLVPIGILLTILGTFFYFTAKKSLDEEMGRRLKTIAESTAFQIKEYHVKALNLMDTQSQTYLSLKAKFEEIKKLNELKSIYIFNSNHESLLDVDQSINPGSIYTKNKIHEVEIQQALMGASSTTPLFKGVEREYYKTGFAPIFSGQEVVAVVGVEGNAIFFKSLNVLGRGLMYISIGCILAVVLVSLLISKKIVSPIEFMAQRALKIGEGDLEKRIEGFPKNELGLLGQTLEDMRSKLHQRETEMQMMLQGIAHEVRNPLGGMELFVDLLGDEISEDSQKISLEKIKREIKNLKNVTEEFLLFAKKTSINSNVVDLKDFFNDLKFFFISKKEKKEIEWVVERDEALEAWVFDGDLMKRVFLNLIQNSVESIEKSGKILVHVKRHNDQLHIEFSDTGHGIKSQWASSVFKPFFTTKEKGTGLGLAFCKKIIDAHQGSISFLSEEKKGVKFTIVIPEGL